MAERSSESLQRELRSRLLEMGAVAEEMVHISMAALIDRDEGLAAEIEAREEQVNRFHIEIDDRCFKVLARFQPAAADLRRVVASMKINSDLERIADLAVNMSQSTAMLMRFRPLKKTVFDIPRMAEIGKGMLREALNAYASNDANLAASVIERDSLEDYFKRQSFDELLAMMKEDSSTVSRALSLVLISRNLERIADHAANIAEDVVFMVQGKDVRHPLDAGARPAPVLRTAFSQPSF